MGKLVLYFAHSLFKKFMALLQYTNGSKFCFSVSWLLYSIEDFYLTFTQFQDYIFSYIHFLISISLMALNSFLESSQFELMAIALLILDLKAAILYLLAFLCESVCK